MSVRRHCESDGSVSRSSLPKRWIIERTIGWLKRCRRLISIATRSHSSNPHQSASCSENSVIPHNVSGRTLSKSGFVVGLGEKTAGVVKTVRFDKFYRLDPCVIGCHLRVQFKVSFRILVICNSLFCAVYLVHSRSRKSLGEMTRKLSDTLSHRVPQFFGTFSLKKLSRAP